MIIFGGDRGDGRHGGRIGKGNGIPPFSDEEEDSDILISGNYDEGGRQRISKDLGSGGTEEPVRPGESRAGKTLRLETVL